MRIAITNLYCWPWVRRGSERLIHELAELLMARGDHVTLIATGPVAERTEMHEGALRKIVYPQRLVERFGGRLSFMHAFAWQVRDALLRESFDAVHCLTYYDACGVAITRTPAARNTRLIFQIAGIPVGRNFWTRPLDLAMLRCALRRADVVAVVSQAARVTLERDFGTASVLLPAPTHTELFGSAAKPSGTPPVILFVADLAEQRKGARPLALAFDQLRRVHPKARLRYSGRVDERIAADVTAGLPPDTIAAIDFLDLGQVADLPALYASATVFALPSIWEAFGMVLIEAMAAGTPVVGCRHGGVADVITDPRTAVLVEPGSVEGAMTNIAGLCCALERAIELAARPETAGLCKAHASRYSWHMLGGYYEALYNPAPHDPMLASPPRRPRADNEHRPRVTVVIPTWRRPAMLERLLRSLMVQRYPVDRFEVLVVHRETDDGTPEIVERLQQETSIPMRVVFTAYQGPGGSRQDGASQASGDCIAFIDDDCVASPDWLAAGTASLEPGVGLVQGRTRANPAQPRRLLQQTIEIDNPTPFYETCNIFYDRQAFEAVGGFSAQFLHNDHYGGEDTDLGWKVRSAGWATAFAPEAVVLHEVFDVSLRYWLMRPRVYAVLPIMAARFPGFREHLFMRTFLSRVHFLLSLALVGVAGSLVIHPAVLVLALPYFYERYRNGQRFARPATRVLRVIAGIPRGLIGLGVLALASLRHRSLVL